VNDARARRTIADARGVVLVEFLIAFIPVFVLFLAIVQLALIAAAQLIVRHAAYAAARSATVVLDDDPRFYAGAARGSLSAGRDPDADWERRFARRFDARTPADPGVSADGARMAAIRRAAHAKLAAIVPDAVFAASALARTRQSSVADALGARPASRLALAFSGYAAASTALTFPDAPGSSRLQTDAVAAQGELTLRVTHLFACLVPFVSWLLCSRLTWDPRGEQLAGGGAQPDMNEGLRELRFAPRAHEQRALTAGIPFTILRAEATLPAHNARYAYASERNAEAAP
jgi:hypothetical protein